MYYLIEPLCHGNGGWSGERLLAQSNNINDLLNINLKDINWNMERCPYTGRVINQPRICGISKDLNDALYILDHDTNEWEAI